MVMARCKMNCMLYIYDRVIVIMVNLSFSLRGGGKGWATKKKLFSRLPLLNLEILQHQKTISARGRIPKSLDPLHKVSYYIDWVKTAWTYSITNIWLSLSSMIYQFLTKAQTLVLPLFQTVDIDSLAILNSKFLSDQEDLGCSLSQGSVHRRKLIIGKMSSIIHFWIFTIRFL